jgi:sugar lactone lactonase YvrE
MNDIPISDDSRPSRLGRLGSLYIFAAGKTSEVVRTGLTIPNSVGWSPDQKTMYFTHSTTQQVIAWDYDSADGSFANGRVFYQHGGSGDPDGFRVHVDENLWHAVYGESCVLKISPRGEACRTDKAANPEHHLR